jgi:hypothetical protein
VKAHDRREYRDPRVTHLAAAMQKVGFLEHRIREVGDPRGHLAREVAALCWLIETARDSSPEIAALIPTAEAIAEDRLQRALAPRG